MSSAIEVIGNQARTEILRLLSLHGPLTATELAEYIGTSRPGVHKHLSVLEGAGLIVGDHSATERQGRTVRWSVQPAEVAAVAQAWLRYATNQPSVDEQ